MMLFEPFNCGAVAAPSSGFRWKLINFLASGSLRLISSVVSLVLLAASAILSCHFEIMRLVTTSRRNGWALANVWAEAKEEMDFVSDFQREYGSRRPRFVAENFVDAMRRSRNVYKLLFVYLHSLEHPDTSVFCQSTLCWDAFSAVMNEHFVAWGESIRTSEGFKTSIRLKDFLSVLW